MERAYSPMEIFKMQRPVLEFEGEWQEAFGQPDKTGTWIIWGNSGNGKSSFVMKLAKELCKHFNKVAYDSLEEGTSLSFQKNMQRAGMDEVNGKFIVLDCEPVADLIERLKKKKSPECVIIDSFQYSGLSYITYRELKEMFRNKLLIFISHADGKLPGGRPAKAVMYDAGVKIYVEGYRAYCKGRYIEKPNAFYTIWEEGASSYWGEKENKK